MLWKILILILLIWCQVYTMSYGIFEYKNKNTPGATGVFALCALLAFAAEVVLL